MAKPKTRRAGRATGKVKAKAKTRAKPKAKLRPKTAGKPTGKAARKAARKPTGKPARKSAAKPKAQRKMKPKVRAKSAQSSFARTYLERYHALLAKNTALTNRQAISLVSRIISEDERDIFATAEKAYAMIHAWRNGDAPAEAIEECSPIVGSSDLFACAHHWARKAIALAGERGVDNPYGYWAEAYVYKYEREPHLSAFYYSLALGMPPAEYDQPRRKRRHLIAEWAESQVYWLSRDELPRLVSVLDADPPTEAAEHWMNWIKCFALHLCGRYAESNKLYPAKLPKDADVSLIIAANYARLGDETKRREHRQRFLQKEENARWSADVERERSPFVDPASDFFWHESVTRALA